MFVIVNDLYPNCLILVTIQPPDRHHLFTGGFVNDMYFLQSPYYLLNLRYNILSISVLEEGVI